MQLLKALYLGLFLIKVWVVLESHDVVLKTLRDET